MSDGEWHRYGVRVENGVTSYYMDNERVGFWVRCKWKLRQLRYKTGALRWERSLRRLHFKICLRLTARQRAEEKYACLLEKYEHLAADRAMWIERAHGREAGWPLPENLPQNDNGAPVKGAEAET